MTVCCLIENIGHVCHVGDPVYGYKNVKVFDDRGNPKTKYEINEDEVRVVKIIFTLYANGNGLKNIVMELIKKGLKTRYASYRGKTTIANILRNETYIGWAVFNKRGKKTRKVQFKPKSEWVMIRTLMSPS